MAINIQDTINKYQNVLNASKTAYNPGTAPTKQDIEAQTQLMKLQNQQNTAQSQQLKTDWYGPQTPTTTVTGDQQQPVGAKNGLLHNILHTLGTPLYATVGAIESILGKGTKSGLANIKANIDEEGTFGDLLRSYNTPQLLAMPLGFALDVALDPLNALFGVGMINKIGKGIKAGAQTGRLLEGATLGAKAAGLQTAENTLRMVPGLARRTFPGRNMTGIITAEETARTASTGPVANFYRKVSEKSGQAADEFNNFLAKPIESQISTALSPERLTPFEKFDALLQKSTFGRGISKLFKYNASDPLVAETTDKSGKVFDNLVDDDIFKITSTKDMTHFIDDGARAAFETKIRDLDPAEGMLAMRKEAIAEKQYRQTLKNNLDRISNIFTRGGNSEDREMLSKIMGLEGSSAVKFHQAYQYFQSGLDSWDRQVAKALTSPMGRRYLDGYAKYIGLFKTAKIGGNLPAALMNATMGNLAMTAMYGIDIANPGMYNSLSKAFSVFASRSPKVVQEIFGDTEWQRIINERPEIVERILGLNPKLLAGDVQYFSKLATELTDSLQKAGKSSEGLTEAMRAYAETVAKAGPDQLRKTMSDLQNVMRKGATTTLDGRNVYLTQEIMSGPFAEWVKKVEQLAIEKKPGAQLLHWYLTKPMDIYSKSDQLYRVGLANHLWKNGVNEMELQKMLHRKAPISASDIIRDEKRNIYYIKPASGLKVAEEAYMNYLNMPGFVRIMRSLPIVGSPFFTFIYGMSALTAKTAVTDPALFNRVQMGIKEISGSKSPLEKEALNSPYASWLQRDGMVKLPFFQNNPLYLNAENWIPYYTMNIFQTNERTYPERFGSHVATVLDKLPFLKTPDGQLLFDYVIQPMILGDTIPKNSFDQQLWPASATAAQKVGYALRGAAETVTPPTAGYLGLFLPTDKGQAAIPYIPNYNWRAMANARQGKNSIGAQTMEPGSSKALRKALSMTSINTYPVNLTYNRTNTKQ